MMNANGDASDEHIQKFIKDTALHDVVAHLAPELKGQSTYTNGKKIMGYILVSEELLEAGTKAGYTDFLQPFISDYRGVYWDVDCTAPFDSNKLGPTNVTHRGLQLGKPLMVEMYVKQLKNI